MKNIIKKLYVFIMFIQETKLLGLIGNLIIILGLFLPMFNASVLGMSKSISYIEGDGAIVLVLSIASLLIIFSNKLEGIMPYLAKVKNQKFTLIPTAISAILLIITSTKYSSLSGQFAGSIASVNLGIGFWIIIIGIVISFVYPFLYKENK